MLALVNRLFSWTRSAPPSVRRVRPLCLEGLEDRCVPTLLGQQLFPLNNAWNQKITNAPVATNSTAIINNIISSSSDGRLHPDFGQYYGTGADLYGIPFNVVHGNSTPRVSVVIDAYPGESDIVSAPIPATVVIEGDYQNGPKVGVNNRGDSHLLVYDVDNNVAYEFFRMSRPSENTDGKWHADQQSVWDMKTNTFRTIGWTSADAAGLSILAGLVRPDEALPVSQGGQGVINHAIRFTLRNSIILDQFLYPASHTANPGNHNPAVQPPMGARFRLKSTVDISHLNPQSRIVAQAMKDYGMIVADNGSNFYFSGSTYSVDASNQRTLTWDDDDIQDTVHGLKSLRFSNFEVVDLTPIVTNLSVHNGQAGTSVTVIGKNFSGAAGRLQVLFGNTPATSVTVIDDGQVVAVAPAGSGTVDVRVQSGLTTAPNPDNIRNTIFGYGISAVSANARFTYGNSDPGPLPLVAVGTEAGTPAVVAVYNSGGGRASLQPFGPSFTGGVRVATGDVNDDGVSDLIVAPGVGGAPMVKVYSGVNGALLAQFEAYGSTFTGGVFVASGDVLGLGAAQVIVSPGQTGAPWVKIYDLRSGVTLRQSLQVFGESFTLGLSVGAAEGVLVVGAVSQSGYVKVYDQANLSRVRTLTPFGATFAQGVLVATGGSWLAAGKARGTAEVNVYNLPDLSLARSIATRSTPPSPTFAGGTRVAWTRNAQGDWELLTGTGPGWSALVQYWVTGTWQRRTSFPDFGGWPGGIWVA
jgi:hypothetical protein